MPQFDRLFQTMSQRGATRAILLSDQPIQLLVGSQITEGSLLAEATLQQMLAEIVPPEHSTQLQQDGQFEFSRSTPQGRMNVNVARRGKTLRVVVDAPANLQQEAPQYSAQSSSHAPVGPPPPPMQTQIAPTAPPPSPYNGVPQTVPYSGGAPTMPHTVPPPPPYSGAYPPQAGGYDIMENSSGAGAMAYVPPEIQGGWNWGAFLCHWIWGIGNNTWIALLCFVPCVGWVMPFVLGAKGNEWAWRNKRFNNVVEFKKTQAVWGWVGLGVNLALVLPFFLIISGALFGPVFGRARQNALRSNSQKNLKQIGLGILQFSQDHNERLPTGRTAAEWKNQTLSYVRSPDLYVSPSTGEAYSVNPALSGVSLAAILNTAATPTFYEAKADSLGGHNVAFLDGHIKWMRPSEWTSYRTYFDSVGAP